MECHLEMEGLMPVYVVRLNDGSCLICEADSEWQAREEFVSRWDSSVSEAEELILPGHDQGAAHHYTNTNRS